jgi:hypothetical protein
MFDSGSVYIAHRHMNVEIVNEVAQFLSWEYINGIFIAVWKRAREDNKGYGVGQSFTSGKRARKATWT